MRNNLRILCAFSAFWLPIFLPMHGAEYRLSQGEAGQRLSGLHHLFMVIMMP
jgi:hypothetical protein